MTTEMSICGQCGRPETQLITIPAIRNPSFSCCPNTAHPIVYETCCDECDYNDQLEQAHADYESNDSLREQEAIANDIDAVIEQAAQPRTFESIVNDWTEACIKANREAGNPSTIALVLRLGLLGQRLIYEANDIGVKYVMDMTKEKLR